MFLNFEFQYGGRIYFGSNIAIITTDTSEEILKKSAIAFSFQDAPPENRPESKDILKDAQFKYCYLSE